MSRHTSEADRADALLSEMVSDSAKSRKNAKRLEWQVAVCWWGAIVCGALASLGGLLAAVPPVQTRLGIEPWHISILALAGSGLVVLRRKTSWRKKSDIFYGRERHVDNLIGRLKYQIPVIPSSDQIAMIAREFDQAKSIFGRRMQAANALEDEPENR